MRGYPPAAVSTDPLALPVPAWAADALARAASSGDDVDTALDLARDVGRALPAPGGGATAQRWGVLAALARSNVTVARVAEAHTDALAILAEAGREGAAERSWGVFAAESPTERLGAETTGGSAVLSGTKPWCSLGAVLDAALVTAHVGAGRRQLFEIDLHDPGVTAHPAQGWVSRGLPTVTSVGLDLDRVPGTAVGGPDWYLTRAGFAWGGMGVAACWYGAAVGVVDRLRAVARDDVRAMLLGRADVALHAAGCVLADAAARIDAGDADGPAGALLALRVRSAVAAAAEDAVRDTGHATGPAPLAFDARHAAQVADLQIYLRQHHAERDLAALGRTLAGPQAQA